MAPTALSSEFFNVTSPSPFVAHVEVNRPAKLNSWTEPMFHTLGSIFNALSADPDVRAIVLTGAGDRAFTAGLDVQAAASEQSILNAADSPNEDGARKAFKMKRHIDLLQASISAVEKCAKPVICVLHGISYGAAIDIASCSDIRLCSKDVRLSVREVDIGLAADLGTLSRLPASGVPMSFVKDVCLTARDFGAQEALSVGFVSGVFDSKAAALERGLDLAKLIASKSPVAVQGTKAVLNYSRDHTIADGMFFVTDQSIKLTCQYRP